MLDYNMDIILFMIWEENIINWYQDKSRPPLYCKLKVPYGVGDASDIEADVFLKKYTPTKMNGKPL